MNLDELSRILEDTYRNNRKSRSMIMHLLLFGIKYADVINSADYNVPDLLRVSGIRMSAVIEICQGINLAEYVKLKD